MLYLYKENIYIFANNKYYKVVLDKTGNLVPTKEQKYELPELKKIDYESAIKHLKNKVKDFGMRD